jgi:threonine dehydrogenase-like Zn-dependent dehydrogenase
MRAAVYRAPREIAVEERPVPELGDHDVLLRVSHCGVCGTDLHLVMEGWGQPDTIGGHEYSGRIVAVGAAVEGWKIGESAVGGASPGCGSCEFCRAHRPALCTGQTAPGTGGSDGAFAEFTRVNQAELVRVPEGLGLREAAIAEPLAVALHGITRSGIQPGQRAFITGAGPIGMFTVAALRANGIDDVSVSEPSRARRELATKVGATRVLHPDEVEIPKMPFQHVSEPAHAAFECSGNGIALRGALAQLAKGGSLVILGTGMEKPRIDANRVLLNELVVTGAYNYDENGFADALALLASGRLPTDLLVEAEDVSLEDMLDAMQRLVAGQVGGKVLVTPN